MANYFLDTSALAKHYRVENGTPEVERILGEPGSTHYVSRLTTVEIQSAFALKVRIQQITVEELRRLQNRIAADFTSRRFPIVRILQSHFYEAERLIQKHALAKALRTLDSLQLAVALSLTKRSKLDYFVCADSALCGVATEEGLSVLNL